MHLNELSLKNFRNYATLSFSPSSEFNYLYGPNGSGKTNLLEAIYFLSHLRSFRKASRGNMMAAGGESMYLKGEFLHGNENTPLRLEAAIAKGDRRYKVNGKEGSDLLSYLAQSNVVIFSPESLRVVKEGPVLRRAFMDRAIAAENPQFMTEYREYNRLLLERNRLLREGQNSDMIAIWEHRLIGTAARIVTRRCVFLNSLRIFLNSIKLRMGLSQDINVIYRAGGVRRGNESWAELLGGDQSVKAAASVLRDSSSRVGEDEKRRGVTLWGPHLDDFDFLLGDRRARESASQGEQRLFVILLVIAVAESYRVSRGEDPIVLLDDLSSELDAERTEAVLGYLKNMGVQVFITSTQKPTGWRSDNSSAFYQVRDGAITAE